MGKGKPPEIKVETDPLKEKEKRKISKKFTLVPKIKRLNPSVIEKFSDVIHNDGKEKVEPSNVDQVKPVEESKETNPTEPPPTTMSSSEALSKTTATGTTANNQPLRIKFSNLMGNRINQ